MPPEDDDPVIATYDVYISPPSTNTTSTPSEPPSVPNDPPLNAPKYYILQYPSHRPSTKPYTTARSQKPTSLRIKPTTGLFEIDVPILTTDNYNTPLGSELGKAMHDSAKAHPGVGHGLAGGFAQNNSTTATVNANTNISMSNIPEHADRDGSLLTQTLGGKLSNPRSEREPVYMLATMSSSPLPSQTTTTNPPPSKTIHLRHLDGLIQMRPQLHHIDATDELRRRTENVSKQATKPTPTTAATNGIDPAAPAKLETKAIEMKLKDNTREDPKDRNLNINARLLRDIQNEGRRGYEWVEKGGTSVPAFVSEHTQTHPGQTQGTATQSPLKSALDNDEWLNRMSSPGIELRTRLKGRDRERARRKRQERARNAKAAGATVIGVDVASDTDGTGSESEREREGDADDTGEADIGPVPAEGALETQVERDVVPAVEVKSPEVKIKEEGSGPSASTSTSTAAAAPVPAPAPKRRGRPPKNAAA